MVCFPRRAPQSTTREKYKFTILSLSSPSQPCCFKSFWIVPACHWPLPEKVGCHSNFFVQFLYKNQLPRTDKKQQLSMPSPHVPMGSLQDISCHSPCGQKPVQKSSEAVIVMSFKQMCQFMHQHVFKTFWRFF